MEVRIVDLNATFADTVIVVCGRVHTLRLKGKLCFIILRDQLTTVQVVAHQPSFENFDVCSSLTRESLVQCCARVILAERPITGTSKQNIELQLLELNIISLAEQTPILLADLEVPYEMDETVQKKIEELKVEEFILVDKPNTGKKLISSSKREVSSIKQQIVDKKKSIDLLQYELQRLEQDFSRATIKFNDTVAEESEKVYPLTSNERNRIKLIKKELQTLNKTRKVGLSLRLDHRVIDLRTQANQAIFRIKAGVCALFRQFLNEKGFIEIQTPKLIGTASESGSSVFKLSYFDKEACLAQSPQLYKQMAVNSDLQRVYEIGPIFRAEDSNTHRHLTEFTGLDLEMVIKHHYNEILDLLTELYEFLFTQLYSRYPEEIHIIHKQYFAEDIQWSPLKRFTWKEIIVLLREAGENIGDLDDISTRQEKLLGQIIKATYGIDCYIVDKFPAKIRPFYTMPDVEDDDYSNAYDVFLRGEEICSGSQRIHDVNLLKLRAEQKNVDLNEITSYIESFKYGSYMHGGAGIGLERFVMLFLGLKNIRLCSLFPRDPGRLEP